ncbi:MAG: Ig-like domain-containing protein [Epsilonproteobacteria bacterium]|nr:Ig-like domain-containing protein [Campylobacterota bacterium]
MRKLLTFILLLSLGITLNAKEIDITKTKGVEQEVINALTPAPMSIETKRGKNIKITFAEKLDPKSIDKDTMKLTYLGCQTPKLAKLKVKRDNAIDQCKNKYKNNKIFKKLCIKCAKEIYQCQKEQKCHKKEIKGKVKYLKKRDILLFNPHKRLKPGFYEVKVKSLKTKENQKIKKIAYRFEISKNSITEITLTPEIITLTEGETTPLELTVHYQDSNSTNITENINWIIADESIVSIETTGVLTALKNGTTLVQAEYHGQSSKLISVTVNAKPEIINGYTLPPEPDPKINNATLLGVDSNANGVRDDVERYVIKRYAQDPQYPKTKTAIALQYAWADQKMIENPTKESMQYEDDALDCQFYWEDQKTTDMTAHEAIIWSSQHEIYDTSIKETIFNTKERLKQYVRYNTALSGGMYPGRVRSLQNCQTNIDVLGE